MPQGPEDIAREQIDRMLVSAGWTVQDAKVVNLYAKQGVAIREFELKSGYGTADYLLCNSMGLTPRSCDDKGELEGWDESGPLYLALDEVMFKFRASCVCNEVYQRMYENP